MTKTNPNDSVLPRNYKRNDHNGFGEFIETETAVQYAEALIKALNKEKT